LPLRRCRRLRRRLTIPRFSDDPDRGQRDRIQQFFRHVDLRSLLGESDEDGVHKDLDQRRDEAVAPAGSACRVVFSALTAPATRLRISIR